MKGKIIPILIMTFVFYCTFIGRIIFAPLLPIVVKDLGINYTASGAIFMWISLGMLISSVLSGILSYMMPIRNLVYGASFGVGITLISGFLIKDIVHIYVASFFIGFFAGLYLSAGIAIITSIVEKAYWGKAISIHELAPNLSFVSAPFIAELLLRFIHWRYVLFILGAFGILSGILFSIRGEGGKSRAEGKAGSSLVTILKRKEFWLVAFLFGMGVGSAMGVFSMLPLFLVEEKGLDYRGANYLVGFSRIFAIGAAFLSGFLTDRLGFKKVIFGVMCLASVSSVLLALTPKSLVFLLVILQPFFAQAFFPAGFSAISHLSDQEERAMVVGLTIPIAVLIGAGSFPWLMGFVGDRVSLKWGLILVGALVGMGTLLTKGLPEKAFKGDLSK